MGSGRIEASITSPALPRGVQLRKLLGTEAVSSLYAFEVDIESLEPIDIEATVGAPALIDFSEDGVELRRIGGVIDEVTDRCESETEHLGYRLRLTPRASRMALTQTQEVFIDTSVPDIIRGKLALAGLEEGKDFELRLQQRYARREFVVQFQETDLCFVSRLAEHLGISFFVENGERDKLVVTDNPRGFGAAERAAPFLPRGERRGVFALELSARSVPGLHVVADHNDETPLVDLTGACSLEAGLGGGVVEWGAHVLSGSDSEELARIRAEEHEARRVTLRGEAALPWLAAGMTVTVEGHPRRGDLALCLTAVEHDLVQPALGSGVEGRYRCAFRAIPATATYRPPRVTPRPRIHGVVAGVVEPAPQIAGEQPWIDARGRYLVRILFDTAASAERKASLPIRMAQAHAGPNYGIHFPLRPYTEVVVAFTHGDPDRPVILGAVPNAITPAPVVDQNATQHRIKTYSGVVIEIDDGG